MNEYILYLVYVIIAASLASYFTFQGLKSSKYLSAKKPSWFPPTWLFGFMWTIIYLLYSYSWYKASKFPLINLLFIFNMLLNVAWCFFFFYLGLWDVALYSLIALDILLVFQIIIFSNYDPIATSALIPYLCWGLYATALNYAFVY
jgi:tryptophan-rich sensory protein